MTIDASSAKLERVGYLEVHVGCKILDVLQSPNHVLSGNTPPPHPYHMYPLTPLLLLLLEHIMCTPPSSLSIVCPIICSPHPLLLAHITYTPTFNTFYITICALLIVTIQYIP